uniref:RH2 domain-containing protein n=1 Tax=Macrostomum lignano TaxID=282301 RepID=A0A1I8ISM0_9PLAT
PVANGNHHGVGPESEAKRHKLLNNSRRCHIENGIATGAIRPISPPMTLEESIASDWESLTDWGEGHLPEKATPQFLAMVEKVKSGYQARIDGLQQVLDRLTGRCAQVEVDRDELARLRRQVEELRSPDVRRLRAKYDAQKEELQRLRAAVQGYGDGDVNGCSNGDGKLGNGSVEAAIEEEGAEEEPPALELQCAASNGHQLPSPQALQWRLWRQASVATCMLEPRCRGPWIPYMQCQVLLCAVSDDDLQLRRNVANYNLNHSLSKSAGSNVLIFEAVFGAVILSSEESSSPMLHPTSVTNSKSSSNGSRRESSSDSVLSSPICSFRYNVKF